MFALNRLNHIAQSLAPFTLIMSSSLNTVECKKKKKSISFPCFDLKFSGESAKSNLSKSLPKEKQNKALCMQKLNTVESDDSDVCQYEPRASQELALEWNLMKGSFSFQLQITSR